MNWVVQTNLVRETLLVSIETACKNLGYNYTPVKVIPFTDTVETCLPPEFKLPEEKFIPYGTTSLIRAISKSNWDKRGLFFNAENLRTSKWVKELGPLMLNHDAKFLKLSEAMDHTEAVFIRPDNDLKDFCGSKVEGDGIKKFYDKVSAGGYCFTTDIPVVLSEIKVIGWEYRLFMIEDRVITSSSYKLNTMVRTDKRVSQEVHDFASRVANVWRPDEVYVMDVCETDDGYAVVEFNCFNASGFYRCDVEKVVEAVSKYVNEEHHAPICDPAIPS